MGMVQGLRVLSHWRASVGCLYSPYILLNLENMGFPSSPLHPNTALIHEIHGQKGLQSRSVTVFVHLVL